MRRTSWIALAGMVLVGGLLLGLGAVGEDSGQDANRPPSTYQVGLPSIGDTVTYRTDTETDSVDISLSVEEPIETRDPFNETLTATPLRLVANSGSTHSGSTQTLAVGENTGALVWAQLEKDNGRWDRDLTVHSYPTFWGASVLAGKTVEIGSPVDIPVWDNGEVVWISYEIEEGSTLSTFWVNVSVEAEQEDPRARGNLGFADEPRLLMENGSMYPLEVHRFGELRTERTAVEPGEGPRGWVGETLLEPSWTRHPSIEFLIPDDARGSPPHSANTPRMELSLSEAISFAEENAKGLDGYLNEHPEAVLWGAFAHLSGAESRVGPAEFPLVTREEPAQEWILNYESSEADEGWRVRVGISTMSVAQEEVHSEVETYDDHAVPKGFQERLVPIETRQAAFSSVASWAPLIAGDQEVIGFGAERFSGEFHGWFEQPNWQYQLIYRPASNPPAFFASVVYVDALTGSIDRISGTIEFVEAFEDRGLG